MGALCKIKFLFADEGRKFKQTEKRRGETILEFLFILYKFRFTKKFRVAHSTFCENAYFFSKYRAHRPNSKQE